MKDFINIDFIASITKEEMLQALRTQLPAFKWRGGDSDMQGPYISGINSDDVAIKIWLGEIPATLSLSFRRAWPDDPMQHQKRKALYDLIVKTVVPSIGTIVNNGA